MSKRKDRWSAVSLPGIARVQARAMRSQFAWLVDPEEEEKSLLRHLLKEKAAGGALTREQAEAAVNEAREGIVQIQQVADLADWTSHRLETAQLYWVTDPMARVALDASLDVPEIHPERDMPSPTGFIAFEQPLPPVPSSVALERQERQDGGRWKTTLPDEVPVSAVVWHPVPGGIGLAAYARSEHLPPPLIGDIRTGGPMDEIVRVMVPRDEVMSLDEGEMDPRLRALLSFISATWVLMMTPTVAQRKSIDPKTGGEPRPGTAPSVPLVTTIDLRPLRHEAKTEPSDESGRIYRHRWVVRGHWRNQAHGPGRTKRRMTWVPSYIKGPEGAPLLATEKVMVWRR